MRQSIFGVVAADGSVVSGEGFTVENSGKGTYEIRFHIQFAIKPAVVVTIDDAGALGLANAVAQIINPGSARVVIEEAMGVKGNRGFSFIAMGE